MENESDSNPSVFFRISVFVFFFIFVVGFMVTIFTVFDASIATMTLVVKWYCIAVIGVIFAAAPVWLIESAIQHRN